MDSNFQDPNRRIAMLIDGDNAQASLIDKMLVETAKYGVASVRRIYGDWTEASMNSWKKILHNHAIQPIQQFRYTVGKNATDSSLIIDAMDLLHSHRVDSFCIVSSDSDYTRLATRIREEGMFVIGIGKESTPTSLVVACDVFIYTENLISSDETPPPAALPKIDDHVSEKESQKLNPLPLLMEAYQVAAQEDGWAMLSTTGSVLRTIRSDFDPRTYGVERLGQLFRAFPDVFEFNETGNRVRQNQNPLPLLMEAYQIAPHEGGWVGLGAMGKSLRTIRPDFVVRTYGFKLLDQLIRAFPGVFEFSEDGKYIRLIHQPETTTQITH